jgi:flagellar protein FlaG
MDIRPLGSVVQAGSNAPPATDPGATTPTAAVSTGSTSSTSAPVIPTQPAPTVAQVSAAVQKINSAMSSQAQGIEFSVDSSSHRIVVKIVDQQTNQLIRQIPSKEALAIADSLDQTQGLLINQQA